MKRIYGNRESYLPSNAKLVDSVEGIAVAYKSDYTTRDGRPMFQAIGFNGKRSTPSFNYIFRTAEARDNFIATFIEESKKAAERKAHYKESRKKDSQDFIASLKEGAIVYRSWGWEQTNVDFYQVITVGKSSAVLREIGNEVKETSFMAGNTVPIPNAFTENSKPFRIRNGNKYRLWEGRALHCSWYA